MKYILVLVLMLSCVYADREGGPYVGVGYGLLQYNDDGLYSTLKEDKSESLSFYAGAYMNKYFSVEINYVDVSPYTAVLNSNKIKLDLYAVTVASVIHYPFYDDMFDTYIKFGVGDMREREVDAKGFTFVYGLGASFRVSEMFSVKVAYDVYPFGYDEDGDNVSDYNQNIKYLYSALEFQF